MRIGNETILPLRATPQPDPAVYPAGDCGACVLSGVFSISVDEAYQWYSKGGKREPIRYADMAQALHNAAAHGVADRVITATPCWPIPPVYGAWGLRGEDMAHNWFNYLQLAFDARYYALCIVDINKEGPTGPGTNHWVMLCGCRDRYGEGDDKRIYQEVLVSCSAESTPDLEWVDAIEFLECRGGFNALLVRPCP